MRVHRGIGVFGSTKVIKIAIDEIKGLLQVVNFEPTTTEQTQQEDEVKSKGS